MGSTYGPSYVKARDEGRLNAQLSNIWNHIKDQHWFTLAEGEGELGYPQASISAQLRHLRKPKFGGHHIIKKYIDNGLWMYALHDEHQFIDDECECGLLDHYQGTTELKPFQHRLFKEDSYE